MIYLTVLLAVLQVLDVLTTEKILGNGGKEMNPILNYLFTKFGIHNVLVVKAVVVIAAGVLIYSLYPLALIPVCVIYIGVIAWNTYQIFKP